MKSRQGVHGLRKVLIAIGVALVWLAFFRLNEFVFSQLRYSPRANLIFLPAAVRILAVLLFNNTGVAGLILGAFLTLPHDQAPDFPFELLISTSSGVAPLVAVGLCRRFFPIASDLAGLRGWHIAALAVASAASNSAILNASMAISGRYPSDLAQIETVFIGDMLGTAIMLFVVSSVVTLVMRRTRKVQG